MEVALFLKCRHGTLPCLVHIARTRLVRARQHGCAVCIVSPPRSQRWRAHSGQSMCTAADARDEAAGWAQRDRGRSLLGQGSRPVLFFVDHRRFWCRRLAAPPELRDRQARPPSAETAPTMSSGFRDFPCVCSHRLAALMHRAGLRGETIIARSSAISMTPPLRGNPPPSLRPTLVSSRRPTGRSNSALPASALTLVLPSSRVAWPGRRQW